MSRKLSLNLYQCVLLPITVDLNNGYCLRSDYVQMEESLENDMGICVEVVKETSVLLIFYR